MFFFVQEKNKLGNHGGIAPTTNNFM